MWLDNAEQAPDVVFEHGAAEAEDMIEVLAGRVRRRSRLRGWLLRKALERVRQLAGLREHPKYCLVVVVAAAGRHLVAVGAELARKGRLEEAGDIFFLRLEEARAAVHGRDFHAVVEERKPAYEAELRRRHVPRVMRSDGTEPEA